MRFLKIVLGFLVLVAAVIVGGGMLLPDKVHVERSIYIERSPAQVYEVLIDFARFHEWSPWGKEYDPTMVTTLSGPTRGVGAKMEWTGDQGAGSSTITDVVENERVIVALDFGDQGKAVAFHALTPKGDGTQLVWGFDSDAEGNLIGRWFNLMLDKWVGADYQRGLENLKRVVEADPLPAPPAPAEEVMDAGMEGEAEGEPAGAEGEADAG